MSLIEMQRDRKEDISANKFTQQVYSIPSKEKVGDTNKY
jgi:hypothetical protein